MTHDNSSNEQQLREALIRAEQRANSAPQTLEEWIRYSEEREAARKAEARRKKEAEKAAAEKKAADAAEFRRRVKDWWLVTKGSELTDGLWARNEAAIVAEFNRVQREEAVAAKRRDFPGSI